MREEGVRRGRRPRPLESSGWQESRGEEQIPLESMHTRATSANHLVVSGTCLSDVSHSTSVCSLPKVYVKPTYDESDFAVTKPLADETLPIRQVLVDKWSRPGVQAFLCDVSLGPGTSSAARRDLPDLGADCPRRFLQRFALSRGVSGRLHACSVGSVPVAGLGHPRP